MKVGIDLDETVFDFLGKLCEIYNEKTKSNLKPNDIDEWDLSKFIGLENKSIFQRKGFFDKLRPFPDATQTIQKLHNEGFDIYIVTNPEGNGDVARDKYQSIKWHMPYIKPSNIVMTGAKYLLNLDVLIDDAPCYLEGFNGHKIIIDRPYNRHVKCGYRVYDNDWLEVYNHIHDLARNI